MAIQRLPGNMLQSNLVRNGVDLAFETDLLYLDVVNGRIGIGTNVPQAYKLDVNGTAQFRDDVTINGDLTVIGTTTTIDSQNLTVEDNILVINSNASAATDSGIMINRGDANNPAVFYWDETADKFRVGTTTSDGSTRTDLTNVTLAKLQIADPVADEDATTKKYVDDQISSVSSSGVTGDNVQLRYPADSSFGDGAWLGLTATTTVTDAIDDLNETISNVQAGTYIQSVSFTADQTSISLGDTVTLTITTVPTAGANTRYTINWGTGDTTTGTSDSTPSYVYNENSGTPYTVTVKADENDAAVTDLMPHRLDQDTLELLLKHLKFLLLCMRHPQEVRQSQLRTTEAQSGSKTILQTLQEPL
jgi:hypothetical protein